MPSPITSVRTSRLLLDRGVPARKGAAHVAVGFDRNCRSLFASGMNLISKATLAAIFLSAFSTAQAQLAFEQSEIELHPKATDQEAIAIFKFENKGTKPVKITSVKSSCGCTVASSKQDELAPG